MDPSLLLDQMLQDVSNLPAEFRYMLEEVGLEDKQCLELRKRYQQKEGILHKYIKQNGSLAANPKEDELLAEVEQSMAQVRELQEEKCQRANTILFLVSRHLNKLQQNIIMLEEDGLLAPAEDEMESGPDFSRESSVVGSTVSERKRKAASEDHPRRKKQSRSMSNTHREKSYNKGDDTADVKSPASTEREGTLDLQNYQEELFSSMNDNEKEDQNLYCFCQRVSFGEMVACDGPNCKYEWFHYECVNLTEPPKGTWYCPDCKQEMSKKLKKKKQ
ncbi:Chromatin modification-related protein YNG2 [Nakaseomyces glabratus]|uniref:Chromatin modification-related protein n=1 Tax=Candida glabrata TaxID=5478 RepID=A0A0W0CUZ7_CANGB|nr:Chromatin modification-related protein YNG2 [Nakaseomyces glabratus]KTA99007.1 Chromatin modification-related protein YNG2 [Nakaseomyces glabratus]KTB03419.1 Chromatin modification-related protein YNG2 [Nakaseomyces glabratus]KTB21853.1 Chromatin modification-related protein YNG2 [Nakaseomyces glabratus]